MSTSTSAACCSGTSRRSAARTSRAVSVVPDGSDSRPTACQRVQRVVVVAAGRRAGRAPAHPVQAGVDDNPVQPGHHRGVTAEGGGPAEGRDHRVLQRVGGFLTVTESADRHRPQLVPMAPEQGPERVRVALDMPPQQVVIGQTAIIIRGRSIGSPSGNGSRRRTDDCKSAPTPSARS